MTPAPHVLITDGETRFALAACRGLRGSGYRVSVVARRANAPAHWSRSCQERITLPDPRLDAALFMDALGSHLKRRNYTVLLPASEVSLRTVSEYRDEIENECIVGLPAHSAVIEAFDKTAMLEHAGAVGLDPPPSVICSTVAGAIEAVRTAGCPMIVKPSQSQVRRGPGWKSQRSILVRDVSDLDRIKTLIATPLTVQQYQIGTSIVSVSGVAFDGMLLAVAVARRARSWPPLVGPCSFSETIVPPEGTVDAAAAFLSRIDWRGVFEIELLETRAGYAMMDFNPRLFGSLALPIAAGANLPAIWCDRLRGVRRPPTFAATGHRYRFEAAEINNVLLLMRRRQWWKAARIALPQRRVVHSVLSLRDPAPAVADVVRRLRTRRQRRRSSAAMN
jgi:predicted ATP-grasp superfamily ATP-dependent carboligase